MIRASSFRGDKPLEIRVDCHAGYRGEESPRRLTIGKRRIDVVTILDRWLAPDHRYFKLHGDDGGQYIIRHDPHRDFWQLVCFTSDRASAPWPFVSSRQYPRRRC